MQSQVAMGQSSKPENENSIGISKTIRWKRSWIGPRSNHAWKLILWPSSVLARPVLPFLRFADFALATLRAFSCQDDRTYQEPLLDKGCSNQNEMLLLPPQKKKKKKAAGSLLGRFEAKLPTLSENDGTRRHLKLPWIKPREATSCVTKWWQLPNKGKKPNHPKPPD